MLFNTHSVALKFNGLKLSWFVILFCVRKASQLFGISS